jgi:type I restriction enzyme M protein
MNSQPDNTLKTAKKGKSPKAIASTQSLSSFVKAICDVMRRSNCASALQYVPELTWILFLRILDAQEQKAREEAEALGNDYSSALTAPYRWQDWASPFSDKEDTEARPIGWKRKELYVAGDGKLFDFINNELLPHLHSLDVDLKTQLPNLNASRKQRVIGRIMTAVEKVRVDNETNLRDILDKVHEIHIDHIDDTHFFTLSQVYEDLLLKMGEKNSDGGQFLPRAKLFGVWCIFSIQKQEKRFTILVAVPAGFWRWHLNILTGTWVIRPPVPYWIRSNTIHFLAGKRKIWYFLSR